MTPSFPGADPSDMLFRLLSAALPGVDVGWDMPSGDGPKCLIILSPGACPTPVTQHMTVSLSCYATQPDGSCDWVAAAGMFSDGVRALLSHRKTWPLVDAAIQSGPIRRHDGQLGIDYAYGEVLLTVATR